MILGINRGKSVVVSVNGTGGSGGGALSRGFSRQKPIRKLSGSKEHLDWLKIDLNTAKTITAQDYKHKKLMWMEVLIYSSIKAIVTTDIVKDIVTIQKGQNQKKIS